MLSVWAYIHAKSSASGTAPAAPDTAADTSLATSMATTIAGGTSAMGKTASLAGNCAVGSFMAVGDYCQSGLDDAGTYTSSYGWTVIFFYGNPTAATATAGTVTFKGMYDNAVLTAATSFGIAAIASLFL